MTSYLVTGATGFLGLHFVERLLTDSEAKIDVLVRKGVAGKIRDLCPPLECG